MFSRCPAAERTADLRPGAGEQARKRGTLVDMQVRDTRTRVVDARALIEREVDAWVSSAGADGRGYVVPLSYYWDGRRMVFAANARSPTVVNLSRAGWARVALGPTRDVVIIEGPVEIFPVEGHDELAGAHAAAAGFDARGDEGHYAFIELLPETIQAWRTSAELRGRTVMRAGRWLV
jgi:hypothetical protein